MSALFPAPTSAPTPAPTSAPTASRDLSRRLRHEWAYLARQADAVRAARSWRVTDRPFDDLDGLLTLAGHRRPADPDADDVLRRLLVVGADEPLACRVVLQRMLPGLLGVVRRRASSAGSAGLLEELVGAAWITIRCYDPSRRPTSLAAALVWSAEHRAFRATRRRGVGTERPVDPASVVDVPWRPVRSPCEELAGVLAEARARGVPEEDLAFVRHLLGTGSPGQVARELDVTARTVRNRRAAVSYRVRRAVDAA